MSLDKKRKASIVFASRYGYNKLYRDKQLELHNIRISQINKKVKEVYIWQKKQ